MSLEELDRAIDGAGGAEAVVKTIKPKLARPQILPLAQPETPAPRKLSYVTAADLPEIVEAFDDELVEGVIGRAAMAVIYGDSNSGKTFFAVELASCLNLALPFLGSKNTAGGIVVYLATEAAASVRLRFQARRKHHGVTPHSVVIVQSPINLFDGDADVTAVLLLVDEIEALFGDKVALIIGDTMARISAGAKENAGEDMGVVLKHADAIRGATGATFLWIHHSGKDAAKGMRGWSGMRAAMDTEIEVTEAEGGLRTAEITKQRDLPGKGEKLTFRLQPVELGVNRWGTPRGSCVVVAGEAEQAHVSAVMQQVSNRRIEEIAIAGFHALAAMGIKTTDEPRSKDCLAAQMLNKGLADGHSKKDLHAAIGRLMGRGIFVRGEVGKYGNGTAREGLVLTGRAAQ